MGGHKKKRRRTMKVAVTSTLPGKRPPPIGSKENEAFLSKFSDPTFSPARSGQTELTLFSPPLFWILDPPPSLSIFREIVLSAVLYEEEVGGRRQVCYFLPWPPPGCPSREHQEQPLEN